MLNFDVKRKINTLRDILVGKVPDPKAQVEQITIALIYKFMDDMDLQGAEFGGVFSSPAIIRITLFLKSCCRSTAPKIG